MRGGHEKISDSLTFNSPKDLAYSLHKANYSFRTSTYHCYCEDYYNFEYIALKNALRLKHKAAALINNYAEYGQNIGAVNNYSIKKILNIMDKNSHKKIIWFIACFFLFPMAYFSGKCLLNALLVEPSTGEPPIAGLMLAIHYVLCCWLLNFVTGIYGIVSLRERFVFTPRAWRLNRSIDSIWLKLLKLLTYGLNFCIGAYSLIFLMNQDWYHVAFITSFVVGLNFWVFLLGTVYLNRKSLVQ